MPRIVRSDPSAPGITRTRRGRGFSYTHASGRPVRDASTLQRIEALVIPPAWRDVWICPRANGHIQAIGIDERGRRQYLYLPAWSERRQARKWERVVDLGRALPQLREEADALLVQPDAVAASQEAAIALGVRLLDNALLRVGSVEYQRSNGTYGLCTLQRRHVDVDGECTTICFVGKHGRRHRIQLHDEGLATLLEGALEGRGRSAPLVGWRDAQQRNRWRHVRPAQLNAWISERVPGTSAKDIRSWHGSVLAAAALVWCEQDGAVSRTAAVPAMARAVADALGNTPAVARSSYVHPAVIDGWLDGRDIRPALGVAISADEISRGLLRDVVERAVLDLIDDLTPATMRRHARELALQDA